MYESLYKLVSDEVPPKEVEVEFKFNIILKIDKIEAHSDFSYDVQKTQYRHQGTKELTKKKLIFILVQKQWKISEIGT